MAGIPQNFQAISNVLANYDFVDIASGTGYITFYVGRTTDLYLLSNITYYSNSMTESGSTSSGTYVLLFDHDYDVVLNRPLDIKGKGIINLPMLFTSGANFTSYFTLKLRKWDGVTETDICSNDSDTWTGIITYVMGCIDLDIPLTHFKIGETLRLTVEGYGKSTAGTNTLKYAHDPMARTAGWDGTGTVSSKFTFQCPVRLNL